MKHLLYVFGLLAVVAGLSSCQGNNNDNQANARSGLHIIMELVTQVMVVTYNHLVEITKMVSTLILILELHNYKS